MGRARRGPKVLRLKRAAVRGCGARLSRAVAASDERNARKGVEHVAVRGCCGSREPRSVGVEGGPPEPQRRRMTGMLGKESSVSRFGGAAAQESRGPWVWSAALQSRSGVE